MLAVESQGLIMGVNGVLCSGAGASLVSLGQALDMHDASCLVRSSKATVFANSPSSDVLENEITHTHVPSVMQSESDFILEPTGVLAELSGASSNIDAAVSGDTAVWEPTEAVLEQHRLAYAAYYHCTAELPRLRDLVQFFHDAWDHPSRELMCKIVDNKMLTSLPKELTSKVIRKYFPQC